MINWLKQNWFKLTIAAAVILVAITVAYNFIFNVAPTLPLPIGGEKITKEAPIKTTFYTKNSTNIRECPSLDCAVIGQYEPNFVIELSYKSVDEMPEWVMITWKVNDTEKNGYVSKVTLSQTKKENMSSVQQLTNSNANNAESVIEYGINFLVALTCLTPPGNEGIISASGIVIGFGTAPDGRKTTYILTNNHVLENSYSNPDQNSYPGLGKYPCAVSWPSETEEGQLASYVAEIYNPASISKSVMTNIDFGFLRLKERVENDLTTIRENSSLVLAIYPILGRFIVTTPMLPV